MREKLESEMREMRENITRLQKMERVLEQEGEKLSQEKKLQEKLRVGRRTCWDGISLVKMIYFREFIQKKYMRLGS